MKIASIALGLALMAASATHAISSVASKRAPMAAAALPGPWSGAAQVAGSNFLLKQAIVENEGAVPDSLPSDAIDLASSGAKSEPLALVAYRIIAFGKDKAGDREGARDMLQLLPQMSKRDSAANIWLAEDYGRAGDAANALQHLDFTLRSSSGSKAILLPQVVASLGEPESAELMVSLLENKPNWAPDFWRETIRRPILAIDAAPLRMALPDELGPGAEVDLSLLANLVQNNRVEEASRLYRHLSGRDAAATFSSGFSAAPAFPPFDWDLVREGELGAAVNPSSEVLLLSAVNGSQGVIARRMLVVESGEFRLAAVAASEPRTDARLSARLRCNLAEPMRSIPLEYSDGVWSTSWRMQDPACAFVWLELYIDVPVSSDPADITLESISLSKVGG